MKKFSQGSIEIHTTKADAIDKFRQMQGYCREEISGENSILFKCTKKGKITIFCQSARKGRANLRSIRLLATITEQNGKIYANYLTRFSRAYGIVNSVLIGMDFLFAFFLLPFVKGFDFSIVLAVLLLNLAFLGYSIYGNIKEKENLQKDSKIMVNELEKRIEAINLWDK